jgi:hypothetical protein
MITTTTISKEHRTHDTALRHKIRNLRAKVRLLLPLELCCKEQRRSKNLMKMDHNRRVELSCHHKHRWNFTKEGSSELYVPDRPLPLEKHLFEKLTNAEVEQVPSFGCRSKRTSFTTWGRSFSTSSTTSSKRGKNKRIKTLLPTGRPWGGSCSRSLT